MQQAGGSSDAAHESRFEPPRRDWRLTHGKRAGHYRSKTTIQGFHRAGLRPAGNAFTDDAGTTQYLPAVQPQRRQPPMLGEVLPANQRNRPRCSRLAAADGAAPRAHIAKDRAKGSCGGRRRCCCLWRCWRWPGAIIAFGVAGTVPAVLTFLLLMATVGGSLYLWESRTEYAHSRGGIERLRIVESADLEMARIDGELELRRMALEAYINLYKESNRE